MLDAQDQQALDAAAAAAAGNTDLGDTGGLGAGGESAGGAAAGNTGAAQGAQAAQGAAPDASAQDPAQGGTTGPSPASTAASTAATGATGLGQDLASNPGIAIAEHFTSQSPSANAAIGVTGYGGPSSQLPSFNQNSLEGRKSFANAQMLSQGWTPTQAAGLGGMLLGESSTLNPAEVNSIGASGVGQWLGERKAGLEPFSHSPLAGSTALEQQLNYMNEDLRGNLGQFGLYQDPGARSFGNSLLNGAYSTPEQIAQAGMQRYERPSRADQLQSGPKRQALAGDWAANAGAMSPYNFEDIGEFGQPATGIGLFDSTKAQPIPQPIEMMDNMQRTRSVPGFGIKPTAAIPGTPSPPMLVGRVQPNGQIVGQFAGFGSPAPQQPPTLASSVGNLAPIQTDYGTYQPTPLTNEQYIGQFPSPTFGPTSLFTGQPTGYAPERYSQTQIESMLAPQAPAPAPQQPIQTTPLPAVQTSTQFPIGPVRTTGYGSPPTRPNLGQPRSSGFYHGSDSGDHGSKSTSGQFWTPYPRESASPTKQKGITDVITMGNETTKPKSSENMPSFNPGGDGNPSNGGGLVYRDAQGNIVYGHWNPAGSTGNTWAPEDTKDNFKPDQSTIDQNMRSVYGPAGNPTDWYRRQADMLLEQLRRLGVRV